VLIGWKHVKIIFFIFLKLFLISAHQNDIKILKKKLILKTLLKYKNKHILIVIDLI
jgi:hypothetical protein